MLVKLKKEKREKNRNYGAKSHNLEVDFIEMLIPYTQSLIIPIRLNDVIIKVL